MATNPVDPVDEEIERLLSDPEMVARLEEYERQRDSGDLDLKTNDDARRIVGLPPRADEE